LTWIQNFRIQRPSFNHLLIIIFRRHCELSSVGKFFA